MAAGVSGVRLLDFAAGTGAGIVPKILFTAIAGSSIILAAAIWIGSRFLAGRWPRR